MAVAETRGQVTGLRNELAAALGDAEVRSWDQLQPLLVYMIDVFDLSREFETMLQVWAEPRMFGATVTGRY